MNLQNFRISTDFFTLDHYRYLCGVVYSKLLEDEYKIARKEHMQEYGYVDMSLSGAWIINEEVKAEKVRDQDNLYVFTLKHPVFVFPFDERANGIQTIRNLNFNGCTEFVRETAKRKWALCDLPTTNVVFWYEEAKKIYLANGKCGMEKARLQVSYLSDPADISHGEHGGEIPTSKEYIVITAVLDMMKKAAQGQVVDMTNNANPNKKAQTEIDTVFQNDLTTKQIQ